MANRRWKIDPNKTAMENVYDAANTACRYILSRSKVQLKSNEERRELLDLCIYKGVEIFLQHYIHGEKKYNKKYTLFENIFSACWSCTSYVIDYYLKEIRRRISTTDKMETISYDQDHHPLRTDSKHDKRAVLTAIERQSLFDCNRVSMCVAEDALKYIWECEDEANEFDHKTIDYAATHEHRAQVLKRVRDLVNGGHSEAYLKKRVYNREYNRKRRAKAKAAARNRANPPDPGPSLHPSQDRDTRRS
jgi:hypothetical protein